MKNCEIVKDLLPLVAENMASDESAAFVREHLETCEECKKAYDALKTPVKADAAAPLKSVRKAVNQRGWLIATLIFCLVAALLVGVFARLTKPIPLESAGEAFEIIRVEPAINVEVDGYNIHLTDVTVDPETGTVLFDGAEFTEIPKTMVFQLSPITAGWGMESTHPERYKTGFQLWLDQWLSSDEITEPAGGNEHFIYAYTSLWRLWFPGQAERTFELMLTDDLDAVYYEPFNNTEHETLYLRNGYTPEAGYALPRLVMNYYFAIALAVTILLFIPWLALLLAKKRKVRRVFDILLLVPLCGTIAFLFAGFPATTIEPLRDLIFVCIIAVLLFGTGLSARSLLKKD